MILTQPFGAYYPNIQVGVGKYAHTQCCYCAQSELVTWPHYPIRTVGFFNSSFLENINPTFKWDWANKPKLGVVVVPRSSNQTWRVFYLTSWVNLLMVGLIWSRIYTCWNIFLSYGPILNSLYLIFNWFRTKNICGPLISFFNLLFLFLVLKNYVDMAGVIGYSGVYW